MPPPHTPGVAVRILASLMLLLLLGGTAFALWWWKRNQHEAAVAAAQQTPEFSFAVEPTEVRQRPYARTTTAIGTVRALQSITLRNELPGTVNTVGLQSGQVVEAGAMLVEFDVSVETAELQALEAEARLAESMLGRMEQALKDQGASAADVDRARAERDKAVANVARTQALIDRKKIRAPFRARVGMVDLHKGQYLEPGTQITTLQGVEEAMHVDFSVTQDTAAMLALGNEVDLQLAGDHHAKAKIVAIDARVESATRNTWIRALLGSSEGMPAPGASVKVSVPVEKPHDVMVIPVNSLRRGPAGDHVFLITTGPDGKTRAKMQRITSSAVIGDEVVVKEGLKVGDRIAAAGSFKLFEGALLVIAPAGAASGAVPQGK